MPLLPQLVLSTRHLSSTTHAGLQVLAALLRLLGLSAAALRATVLRLYAESGGV
jgi:hypothetical protein